MYQMSAHATTFRSNLPTQIKAIKNKSLNPAIIPLPKERTHMSSTMVAVNKCL